MDAKRRKVILKATLLAIAVPLLFVPALFFLDSLRYPRIARSAYWRHPKLLVKATLSCLFPPKGISKEMVAEHARKLGYCRDMDVRLLYLSDLPKHDKTIKARVFGLIAKRSVRSKEQLFWVVNKHSFLCKLTDDTMVYEYRTGRLVCAAEYKQLGVYVNN